MLPMPPAVAAIDAKHDDMRRRPPPPPPTYFAADARYTPRQAIHTRTLSQGVSYHVIATLHTLRHKLLVAVHDITPHRHAVVIIVTITRAMLPALFRYVAVSCCLHSAIPRHTRYSYANTHGHYADSTLYHRVGERRDAALIMPPPRFAYALKS